MAFVPLPECRMIGDKAQFSTRCEHAVEVRQRVGLYDAPLVVTPLRPWVAEVDVHHVRDAVRQAVAEEIARIGQQDADMLELVSPKTIGSGTPEVGGPLDAEEVALWLDGCLLAEEGSLA
ncbi:MAG: hypothetical protein FJ256_01005 [Phycisphaerae bacterium]|nr:hypothetical protein [Phycisphaerae bacterium]